MIKATGTDEMQQLPLHSNEILFAKERNLNFGATLLIFVRVQFERAMLLLPVCTWKVVLSPFSL